MRAGIQKPEQYRFLKSIKPIDKPNEPSKNRFAIVLDLVFKIGPILSKTVKTEPIFVDFKNPGLRVTTLAPPVPFRNA
jgi:hypothetical protein